MTPQSVTPPRTRRVFGIALLSGALALLTWAEAASAITIEKAEEEEKKDPPSQEERLAGLERQIRLLSEEIERLKLGAVAEEEQEPGKGQRGQRGQYGLAPSASKIYGVERGASIGGYGEAIFQNPATDSDDGSASGALNEFDFLRAIVYLGYKWNDQFLFNSEIEFEHASTDKSGVVSVEFAYLDFLYRPQLNFRGGMVLIPVGFLNELHEPTVFYGVTRPQVERVIIPTTWRENGGGIFGDIGPFTYRSYVVVGLTSTGFSPSSGLRGGRQKGSKSIAQDFGWTGRLDLTGYPGFLVGGSFFVGDSGQGEMLLTGSAIGGRVSLFDVHGQYNYRGLQLRGLYVMGTIGEAALINQSLGLTGASSIGSELRGWYLEGAYEFVGLGNTGAAWALTPFIRYEDFDTQAEVPGGFFRNPVNDRAVTTFGFEVEPIYSIVLKLDFQNFRNRAGTGTNQWNFGIGYQL